jgi:hypothetical protein
MNRRARRALRSKADSPTVELSKTMSLPEAEEVVRQMDRTSYERFSLRERAAIVVIGLAYRAGDITMARCHELLGENAKFVTN